jgi:hypothetical protein
MHTLVSNVRGAGTPVTLAGAPVTAMIPFSVGEAGNLTVSALALSYAGSLVVTVIADPDHVPDPAPVAADIEAALVRGLAARTSLRHRPSSAPGVDRPPAELRARGRSRPRRTTQRPGRPARRHPDHRHAPRPGRRRRLHRLRGSSQRANAYRLTGTRASGRRAKIIP